MGKIKLIVFYHHKKNKCTFTFQRRMIKLSVQLFSISILCIIGWVPYGVISTMQVFQNTNLLTYLLSTIFIYFPYVQTLFLPYVCLFFMPDIRKKFCTLVLLPWSFRRFHHENRVQPTNRMSLNLYTTPV